MIFRGKSEGPKKNLDLKQQKIVFYLIWLIFINRSERFSLWKKNLFICFSTIQWYIKPAGQHKVFILHVRVLSPPWTPIKLQLTISGCKTSQHWKNAENIHSGNTRTGEFPP